MCFVEMFFCQQDSFAKEVGLNLRKRDEGGGQKENYYCLLHFFIEALMHE